MKYIDKVSDFSIKTAQINSTPIVRRLRSEAKLPFDSESLLNEFVIYFVTRTDIDVMIKALENIPVAIDKIKVLHVRKDPKHVEMSLVRSVRELDSIADPMMKNIEFAKDILEYQENLIEDLKNVFNSIKDAKTDEAKKACDEELNRIFSMILRGSEFRFNSNEILTEADQSRMNNLNSAMHNGFFYQTNLNEAANGIDFNTVKYRIEPEKLKETDEIGELITSVRKGVDCACQANLSMVKLAVTIFSYIIWLTE